MIGPLLFIAYFDKVMSDNAGHGVPIKYADDLIFLHPVNNTEDEVAIQRSIDGMSEALSTKLLKLSSEKCCYTIISESSVPYHVTSPPTVNGVPVSYTDRLVYLGVMLDPKLSWCANTRQKVSKAKQAIGCITRLLKKKVPRFQIPDLIYLALGRATTTSYIGHTKLSLRPKKNNYNKIPSSNKPDPS